MEKVSLKGLNLDGLPKTHATKNRGSLLLIDRKDYNLERVTNQISDMLTDLIEGDIDSFTVEVKERAW